MITSEDIRQYSIEAGYYLKDRPLEIIMNILFFIIIY